LGRRVREESDPPGRYPPAASAARTLWRLCLAIRDGVATEQRPARSRPGWGGFPVIGRAKSPRAPHSAHARGEGPHRFSPSPHRRSRRPQFRPPTRARQGHGPRRHRRGSGPGRCGALRAAGEGGERPASSVSAGELGGADSVATLRRYPRRSRNTAPAGASRPGWRGFPVIEGKSPRAPPTPAEKGHAGSASPLTGAVDAPRSRPPTRARHGHGRRRHGRGLTLGRRGALRAAGEGGERPVWSFSGGGLAGRRAPARVGADLPSQGRQSRPTHGPPRRPLPLLTRRAEREAPAVKSPTRPLPCPGTTHRPRRELAPRFERLGRRRAREPCREQPGGEGVARAGGVGFRDHGPR
jgi:hypothetical protein